MYVYIYVYIYRTINAHHLLTNASQFTSSDCPPVPTGNSPCFYSFFSTLFHMVWNVSLASLGQLPSNLSTSSTVACRMVQKAEKIEMSLALYSTAQQQLGYWCVINTVFLLKLKHSIIPDTMKNVNTVSDETRTVKFFDISQRFSTSLAQQK